MKTIVIFGGQSYEHEISIVSSITLKNELHFIDSFIFIDSAFDMYLIPKEYMTSSHFSSFAYKNNPKVQFVNGGFSKNKLFGKDIINGIVINLIHGKSGEDGIISSLLEFYDINYLGPRIEASVLSFNKELTKLYATSRGVNVLDYQIIRLIDRNQITKTLKSKLPFIIKPARLGSSIGINIVRDINDIEYNLDSSFEFDDTLIIESFIPNIKEYNLAGCKIGDDFVLSIIEEVSKDEYLNFDKKYLDFRGERNIEEADISDVLKNKIKDVFKAIYSNCFEGALIRCDFFVINDEVYLNEINPIPGSLAYYLFSDFENIIKSLISNLPTKNKIKIDYKYISHIHSFKGN